eukprot:ANDGO_03106.mRNA.1 Lysosomal amino acid transporter 1
MCRCDPSSKDGYSSLDWASEYFGECVYTPAQRASLFLGFLSIVCWIFAQLPQVYQNYKSKRADGISGLFLLQWLIGDSCNLIGAFLTHQLPTQQYTAIYFVSMDFVLGGQWLWYTVIHKGQHAGAARRKSSSNKGEQEPLIVNAGATAVPPKQPSASSGKSKQVYAFAFASLFVISRLLVVQNSYQGLHSGSGGGDRGATTGRSLLDSDVCSDTSGWDTESIIGYAIGIVSAIFYLGSRVPQLLKNFRRKSTEGLSYLLFTFAVLGNTTYGLSIFMYSTESEFLIEHIPWICGSVGVLFLDFAALWQFQAFRRNKKGLIYPQMKHESANPLSDEDIVV